jgi:hypothetical protein
MLLMAVILIGAVGLTIGLLARHFVGMTRMVRCSVLDASAAQLVASGVAWAHSHEDRCASLSPGDSIYLPVDGLVPPRAEASLRISRSEDAGEWAVVAVVRLDRAAGRQVAPLAKPRSAGP